MKNEKLLLFSVLLSGMSMPQAHAGWWDSLKNKASGASNAIKSYWTGSPKVAEEPASQEMNGPDLPPITEANEEETDDDSKAKSLDTETLDENEDDWEDTSGWEDISPEEVSTDENHSGAITDNKVLTEHGERDTQKASLIQKIMAFNPRNITMKQFLVGASVATVLSVYLMSRFSPEAYESFSTRIAGLLPEEVKEKGTEILSSITSYLGDGFNSLVQSASSGLSSLGENVSSAYDALSSGASDLVSSASNFGSSAYDALGNAASSVGSTLSNAGYSAYDALGNAASSVGSTLSDAGSSASDFLKSKLPIEVYEGGKQGLKGALAGLGGLFSYKGAKKLVNLAKGKYFSEQRDVEPEEKIEYLSDRVGVEPETIFDYSQGTFPVTHRKSLESDREEYNKALHKWRQGNVSYTAV